MQLKVDSEQKKLLVPIPLTQGSGKIRVKIRSVLNEYGLPTATKQKPFTKSCYIEWQISYDTADFKEQSLDFINYKGITKYLTELSEYIFWFYRWEIISKEELLELKEFLQRIEINELLDKNKDYAIERSNFVERSLYGLTFQTTQVKYPLLVYKFQNYYEVIAEIKITEKQRAVGVQPMLYFCFPIMELRSTVSLIGRTANTKELAYFEISQDNIGVFVEMLKIFGILSEAHKTDTMGIIDAIVNS